MIKELDVVERSTPGNRRPDWLRVKLPSGKKFKEVSETISKNSLNTVCSEARCPNMGECWGAGTATFMILGDVCTRSCAFCAIKTGRPVQGLDWDEPRRVADAASKMKLKHVVLTSVNRDERKDGGAPIFAECHKVLRDTIDGVTIESLIPDFRGVWDALQIVIDTPPDVLSHNLETVPRLYRNVRPQARYERSLELLLRCKEQKLRTKTGIMVGLGETREEVIQLMQDCVDHKVDVLTIGQYMQPTKMHHPVVEWVHPDQFAEYKEIGETLGLEHVESGPLVRSSYHAERHV
ncbi:MAG TPA: lipoyl synthase [Balneolaceae bacterium]|nr:lipoyl synthase [Balneolaceae bacterium]